MTRRDYCSLVGQLAARLSNYQAARAWRNLSWLLMEMEQVDMPKFKHVLGAIRTATIIGKQHNEPVQNQRPKTQEANP